MTQHLIKNIPRGTAVIHVGAHYGQEAESYANHDSPVLWIEACPLFMSNLRRKLADYPLQNCRLGALSSQSGLRRVFHISNNMNGVSSSFYDFGTAAKELWPAMGLKHSFSIPVTTSTLDDVLEQECDWISEHCPSALVIDTQGAELEVLQGAIGSLWRFDWIQVETSNVSVYENGATREAVHLMLSSHGFALNKEIEHRPGHGDRLYKRVQNIPPVDPCFASKDYQEINAARLKHLCNLPIDFKNQSVLELGSGPGDLSSHFLNNNCCVTSIDARPENVRAAMEKHRATKRWSGFGYQIPGQIAPQGTRYEVVAAYGILYHLDEPERMLSAVAALYPQYFILETCVTPEQSTEALENRMNAPLFPCRERADKGSQAITGLGCRPDRQWVWETLQRYFTFVYCCVEQPDYPQFPVNWHREALNDTPELTRMIFICSAEAINSESLTTKLPMLQSPCKE
jgi:FkbM family methyltransferase